MIIRDLKDIISKLDDNLEVRVTIPYYSDDAEGKLHQILEDRGLKEIIVVGGTAVFVYNDE